jgi:hypothetical protein
MRQANTLTAISIASLLMTAPLAAQESNQLPPQPTKDQEHMPGLQQTPEGQTMKTAGEKMKPLQETQAGMILGGASTGPTFPNSTPSK